MLSFHIAVRYLFSPKSHGAINAITLVAAMGVVVITAAMICILSVYNGFENLVRSLTARIDPDIRIEAAEGRFFHDDAHLREVILSQSDVITLAPMLEEQVLLSFSGQQLPAQARGIDSLYKDATGFDQCLLSVQQEWAAGLSVEEGINEEYCIPGIGLAATLGLAHGMVRPITLYLPDRKMRINASTLGAASLEESGAFCRADLFVPDFLRVNQADYDDHLLLLSLNTMRQLMGDSTLLSAYELRLRPTADAEAVKQLLNERLVAWPEVKLIAHTANDLQADAYRIMHIEKWITYLLILFILLIASFNIIGALSMLMIDKESQTQTLLFLGAPSRMINQIYLCLGLLISGAGALAGVILGVALVLIQQHFGLITLGSEATYIVSAYPVQLLWPDVLLTLITVLLLGFLATGYTVSSNRK